MERIIKAHLDRLINGDKFITDNALLIGNKPAIYTEQGKLQIVIGEIRLDEQIQIYPSTGITEMTFGLKKTMTISTLQMSKLCVPLAMDADNKEILAIIDKEISHILYATPDEAITLCRNMNQVISDNAGLGKLFPAITPTDITNNTTDINNYVAVVGNTAAIIEKKKSFGTAAYTPAFEKGNGIITRLNNYFFGYFYSSNKLLYDAWENATKLEVEGVHHTTLIALFHDLDAPQGTQEALMPGGTMKILGINLIATSNEFGLAGIARFMGGIYTVEFSKPGYVTKQMIIKIGHGKTVNIQVDMERVTP